MSADLYKIENDYLALEIGASRSRISDFEIFNKRCGKVIKPAENSELFAVNFKGGLFSERVCASELKIKRVYGDESANAKKLCFEFNPIKVKGTKLVISLVYELENDAHFIRKHLEFFAENPGEKTILDYIDFMPISVGDYKTNSIPKQDGSHISGFALSLGQPVFVSSAFIGCEFPVTVNIIENGFVSVKYYSGKPIGELTCENGKFVSYNAVVGVAESEDETVLHLALYDYIERIAKPLKMRVQYNSWYDHMLNISDESIEQSFLEIEKAMTSVGTNALDCYVVDDGWNDYKSDFWKFNNKFPNELYPASKLTNAFGSSFGLWLGPRGGYTKDTIKFAKQIESGGNGYVNKRSHDIDVGSDKYIRKVSDLMVDLQTRFNLKYWKLDGFIQKPCRNANHDHIVGGKDDMYYYSEVWEKWLGVFERLEKSSENGVFINLTCYAPPSPWMLQWVNCMWLQISDDMGMINKDSSGRKIGASKKDRLLTYRDEKYFEFFKERKFSFPQSRIYNHDPIYANEAKVTMSDREFRDYLFSMAARGNAFWELYYSFNLMNEAKWRINNAALCFVRENLHLLKNCVMFGSKPSDGRVYGYSSFSNDEGIVMLRNSSASEQRYVLRLDETIGVSKNLKDAKTVLLLPYNKNGAHCISNYGDSVNITLAPFQTKIYSFGKMLPKVSAVYIKTLGRRKIEVMFNQTIIPDLISCEQNNIKSVKLLEDYRSVVIEFESDFVQKQSYIIKAVKNIYLEEYSISAEFEYFENDIIPDGCISSKGEFSIVATTGGEEPDVLFSQGDEIVLKNDNGKLYFRVGDTAVISDSTVHDVVQICAIRERNGVLKLYLNKKLDSGEKSKGEAFELKGGEVYRFDESKVKVFSKAFSYNEV